MTAELLLDAIGQIDDRFLFEEASPRRISLRRTAIVFIAAILAALLTFMTAMAVSPEFKDFVYSFVNVKTQETLPIPDLKVDTIFTIHTPESTPVPDIQETLPAEGPMKEQGYQQIDGMVKAKYFTTNGLFMLFDDVIYTCDRNDDYSNPIFWEVTSDGLTPHQATRVEFSLWYGWKRHKIFFDYAVINGRLYEQEWPPGLDRDPYGNGWMTSPVANRTDVVWLELPVSKNKDITKYPLLLDLKTHKVSNLFADLPLDDICVDGIWFSEDLSRAFFIGLEKTKDDQGENNSFYGAWICDLKANTIYCVQEITGVSGRWEYVDENTLEHIIKDSDTNLSTLYRYDIMSGECVKVFENVYAKYIFTNFAVVQNEDFSYWLWDLRTGERRKLDGLYLAGMVAYESPNKNNIVFASRMKNPEIDEWSECYPKIGMLNTETGTFQILKRDVRGKLSEYFYRWLNDTTVVTAAYDGVSGFYIYIYEFTALQS